MKRWQKVVLISICILAALSVAGVITYKKVLEPIINQKLDVVIQQLDNVANNEAVQREMDSIVESMIEDGVITEESIPQYMKMKEENEAMWSEEAMLRQLEQLQQEENSQEEANAQATDKQAPMPAPQAPATTQNTEVKKTQVPQNTQTPAATSQAKPSSKGDLRSRMKEAMTPGEFSFASSLYGKIDIGYAQSLYSKDKSAAKQYVYSKLSSAEISRALEIYAKYSYLVK